MAFRKVYLIHIAFSLLFVLSKVYVSMKDYRQFDAVSLLIVTLAQFLMYSAMSALLALIVSFFTKNIKKYWLPIFAWMLLIQTSLDNGVTYYKRIQTKKLVEILVENPIWTEENKDNAKHFVNSISLAVKAEKIFYGAEQENLKSYLEQNKELILNSYQAALKEAKKVDERMLLLIGDDLKSNFHNYFIRGLELKIVSLSSDSKDKEWLLSQELLDLWATWYNLNKERIVIPK